MELNKTLRPVNTRARDLSEAWFNCVDTCLDIGYEYEITSGSYAGQKRKELDFITIQIMYPGTRPLICEMPAGIPPLTTMDYVEKEYLAYLITAYKKENEAYTYGQDIEPQIEEVIKIYKTGGFDNNRACITVGNRNSIRLEHSQCLRLIDTRIRYGKLHFIVYFRSWDLFSGFPANLAAIQLLKEYIAKVIGVRDGELIACSKGLHLYDHCWDIAKQVVKR